MKLGWIGPRIGGHGNYWQVGGLGGSLEDHLRSEEEARQAADSYLRDQLAAEEAPNETADPEGQLEIQAAVAP